MQRTRTSTTRFAIVLAIFAIGVTSVLPAAADSLASTELKPGDVLDASNWELAKDLLPPEVLEHYRNGEYANPITEWPAGTADFVQGANMAFQCAESIKLHGATVAGIKSTPNSVYDVLVTFNPQLFDLQSLSRFGK